MTPPLAKRAGILADVSHIFVAHPRFAAADDEVRDVISLGPCSDAPCLHVSGPSGVGKTTLRERIARDHPRVPDGRAVRLLRQSIRADSVPVLSLRMPPEPTVKSLGREMLRLLGDEEWYRGDEFMIGDRVDRYLEGCGTAAILRDLLYRLRFIEAEPILKADPARKIASVWPIEVLEQIDFSAVPPPPPQFRGQKRDANDWRD